MDTAIIVTLLLSMLPVNGPPRTSGHVRPLTQAGAVLLTTAQAAAPAVRDLLERLEETDVIVYLTDSMTGTEREPLAYLTFLSRTETARFVLVHIARWDLNPAQRAAALGHELQHALEIAQHPEVVDAKSLARLYRRIGWQADRGQYETDGARAVGRTVTNQLAGFPR